MLEKFLETVVMLGFLGNHKALGSIGIIVLVSALLFLVFGATLAYFWFWPGDLKTEEMVFSDFTEVEVGWAFEVNITQSSSFNVVIFADEKIIDHVEVTQTGKTLTIGFEQGINPGALFRKAEITMPELDKLFLSGATRGTANGFSNSNTFVLGLSGASSLEVTNINVGNAEIELSGASTLNARGTSNDLSSLVTGASKLDLSNFPVNHVDIDVSGASRATINVEGVLDFDVSGDSILEYIGEPIMGDINLSDSSTLKKK